MIVVKNRQYDITFLALITAISAAEEMTREQFDAALQGKQGMNLAIRLWRNLETKLGIEDENERRDAFHHLITTEFGKSRQLSGTYLYNIRHGLYISNKKWNKKNRESKKADNTSVTNTSIATEEDLGTDVVNTPTTEVVAVIGSDDSVNEYERWGVEDTVTNEVIKRFITRTAALEYNKDLKKAGRKTRLWDSHKKSA